MNRTDALRILIAAQDDPVLASWAAVAHEHKAIGSDVSPYECWEAFQQLYDYGLISPDQFNGTDPSLAFFSGRRASTGDVQRVLTNLKILPETEQEYSMTRTKLGNPFADDNALVARDSGGTALNGRNGNGHALPVHHNHEIGNPFAMQNETLPREKRSLELEPFAPGPATLPCRDPSPQRNLGGRANTGLELNLQIFCCGQELQMDVDDMTGAEGPDDNIPGGQVVVLSRVLHGQCRKCGLTHHHSAGTIDINQFDR